MSPEAALRRYFQFENFRPGQDEIVREVASGRDVLVIMPTGGGKSLCYQLPALMGEGVAIVVSPLIALMKDQVDALEARGIPAAFLNSSLDMMSQRERLEGLATGRYKLMYVAPERFRHARFMEQLKGAPISFVAIDEAHCVSQWGHDFRPDYLRIGQALDILGRPPVSAFTATATPEVRTDIVKHLGLREPALFVTGFARPNLEFRLTPTEKRAEKFARLGEIIEAHRTGIIYCATRKRVEEVSEHLEEWNVPHIFYHGGLDDEARKRQQDRFMRGEAEVAVATNAFGMGIDRADIRFVVHFEMTGSIEAYYQEAGRAGRDGLPATCELFFNFADRRTQDFFVDGNNPGAAFITEIYSALRQMADENHEIRISLRELTERLGSKNGMMVSSAVNTLTRLGVLDRFDIPGERIRGTRILDPGLSPAKLPLNATALAEKERRDRAKLQSVLDYGYARGCRQEWILRYFGEEDAGPCGRCDFCQSSQPGNLRSPTEEEWLLLQKVLSGVARMSLRGAEPGEWRPRFGKGKIILMLSGSRSESITNANLDQLSTYGILAAENNRYLGELMDEMLRSGLLQTTGGDRPLITLTPLGDAVMRRQATAKLLWPKRPRASITETAPVRSGKPRREKEGAFALDSPAPPQGSGDLLEKMRKKRLQLAKIQGNVAPFRIFSNAVLGELVARQPRTVEEAMEIPGIGPVKARQVLPPFLEIIEEHRERSAITS